MAKGQATKTQAHAAPVAAEAPAPVDAAALALANAPRYSIEQLASMSDDDLANAIAMQGAAEVFVYLTQVERTTIADSHLPLVVTSFTRLDDGKYGANWEIGVVLDGRSRKMSLSANDYRDATFPTLQKVIEFRQQPLQNWTLRFIETNLGPAYDLLPVTQTSAARTLSSN